MFKKHILTLLLTAHSLFFASGRELSGFSEIYLLTYLPGDELYSIFGHSAIRLKDPVQGIDFVYNYGTFDFSTPFFYIKFVNGTLPYQLSRTSYATALKQMKHEERSVLQQRLALTIDEKNQLYNILETEYLPENRSYLYRFFKNNCSTKIRDIVQSSVEPNIKYEETRKKLTFRQLVHRYMDKKPWTKLGMDLMLGKIADNDASTEETMFLPDYLSFHFALATVNREEGIRGLATRPKTVLNSKEIQQTQIFPKPALFFAVLLFLLLVLAPKFFPKKSNSTALDWVLYGTTSIFGLVLLYVTVNSQHPELGANYNLLWSLPALPLLLLQRGKRLAKSKIALSAYLIYVFLLLVVMIGNKWLSQSIPLEIYPFLIMILIHTGLKSVKLI
jgi:hypothetical protein